MQEFVFETGLPATGDSFIGREREIKKVYDSFYEASKRKSVHYSMTGVNKIGKTSLLKECMRRKKEEDPDCLQFYYSLEDSECFWEFLINGFIKPLSKTILKTHECDGYRDDLEECVKYFADVDLRNILYSENPDKRGYDSDAKEVVDDFFSIVSDLELRPHFIVDEFDRANKIFGRCKDNFGWFRSFLEKHRCISILVISRKSIDNVEIMTYGGSTLAGIFKAMPLYGFNNLDIEEYYRILNNNGVVLSDETKMEIWYYCGRSPYYLSLVGEALLSDGMINWAVVSEPFRTSFERIINLLKEENLYRAMLQAFVASRFELKQSDINKLVSMGYCLEKCKLISIEGGTLYSDFYNSDKDGDYLVVCDYFIDYLEDIAQKDIENVWPNLTKVERLYRRAIRTVYENRYGNRWKEEVNSVIRSINSEILRRNNGKGPHYDRFFNSHRSQLNRLSHEEQEVVGDTYLNVVGFTVLGDVMTRNGDYNTFKRFTNVDIDEFRTRTHRFNDARNPIAHANEGVLTTNDIEEINKYCDQFIKSFSAELDK